MINDSSFSLRSPFLFMLPSPTFNESIRAETMGRVGVAITCKLSNTISLWGLFFFASYIRDLILCDGCRIILQFRVFKTFSGINTSKMLPKLSSWSLSQVKSVCPFSTRPSWDAYRIFIKWFHELSFVEQQHEARDVEHPKSFQERQKINKRSHWFETRLANKFWHCFVFGL